MTTLDLDLGLPGIGGQALVPESDTKLSPNDFKSDQEVRWCPGWG